MSRVSKPKCATIRLAVTGPTPLISPLPRYFSNPVSSRFCFLVLCDLELRPNFGWSRQKPTSFRVCLLEYWRNYNSNQVFVTRSLAVPRYKDSSEW